MKTRIHAIAGATGFVLIFLFWTSTLLSELFASQETVAQIKSLILSGMFILIPAMIVAGGSGTVMGKNRQDEALLAKKKRMPFIAANGLLILLPAAWFLAGKANAGEFDTIFYLIQMVELIAGGANLTMMAFNIKDGLILTGRFDGGTRRSQRSSQPILEMRQAGPIVAKLLSRLTDASGQEMRTRGVAALCRCGRSKGKPYCDGSHNEFDFSTEPSLDRTADELKAFEGEQIAITYNRLLCSHAGECGSRLKSVFDPTRDSWICPDLGSRSQIEEVIKACPSGALSIGSDEGEIRHLVEEQPGITIERNGPYRVTKIPLTTGEFAAGACVDKYVLCRCGESKNKPFCDGTHAEIAWTDETV